jgi:hypothetical protein
VRTPNVCETERVSGVYSGRSALEAMRLRFRFVAPSCASKSGGRVRPPLYNLRSVPEDSDRYSLIYI